MMESIPIARLSALQPGALEDYLAAGAPFPCIIDDATKDWPARTGWTLQSFSDRFGHVLGRAGFRFGANLGGRAVKLRDFIAHGDKPLDQIPGFWVDRHGLPLDQVPDYDESQVWSFMWKPFREDPALFAEIAPFPAAFGSLATNASAPGYRQLEKLTKLDFHSLYITRAGTVTPLHRDHDHTFGSLVQFDGRKLMALIDPAPLPGEYMTQFNPEAPDLAAFPQFQAATAHVAELQRGDMLIIPPDWWHYTRALTPSFTMSHNFFTAGTAARYLASVLAADGDPAVQDQVRATFAAYLPDTR